MRSQPALDVLQSDTVKAIAAVLFFGGNLLVLTSMYALGFTGTYLGVCSPSYPIFQAPSVLANGRCCVGIGDYFGILMDDRVTSFPFNVTDAPMYYGSTMSFLATALW